MGWEFEVLRWFADIRNDVLTKIMEFFTTIGDLGIFWIALCAVFLIIPKTRRIGVFMAVSLVVEVALGEGLLKHLIQRERPFIQDPTITTLIPAPLGKYSFPSGHTTASAAAVADIFLQNRKLSVPFFFVAAMIMLSRLYFCVHFPTDILGGIVLGIAVAVAVYYVLTYIEKKQAERLKADY